MTHDVKLVECDRFEANGIRLVARLVWIVGLVTFLALVVGMAFADWLVRSNAVSPLLAWTGIAALAAAGLCLMIARLLASHQRSLARLAAHVPRMGEGDLATPLPLQDVDGEIGMLARALEASRQSLERKVTQLSEASQWSETLIQSVVEGIITCDSAWHILFFSAGAERITGWSSKAALGELLDDVMPLSGDGGQFRDYVPPDTGRRTVMVRHCTGSVITVAVTRAKPMLDGQITVVIHDITEENRRRKSQSYFLASMSHEFRTPLAGMQASLELLQENLRSLSIDEMQQLLNSIHLSLSMLHQLIDNLLESSKLEANHFSLNRRPAELDTLLGEAIRLIEPMIVRRHQHITLDEPLTIQPLKVDPTRTIQMMVNLLSNASKYSPDKSVIDVMVEDNGSQLRVSVADRGRGIEPDRQTSLFRPFVRLEPESQTDHGSGLGLSVVKAIAEAHQGGVGVEARSGGGSVFWFTLPVAESEG